jgi:hypothetical protein
MRGHGHSEGGAGDYTASCYSLSLEDEAVWLIATEAAVGITLARAGVLPVCLGLRQGVGMSRTTVGSRRLMLGAAVGVGSQEGSQRRELARHRLPLPLLIPLKLAVMFKDGPVVVAIVTDPTLAWLSVTVSMGEVHLTRNSPAMSSIVNTQGRKSTTRR